MLDGGLKNYTGPCESGPSQPRCDKHLATVWNPRFYCDFDSIQNVRDDKTAMIVDCRPTEGFAAANITGAVSCPSINFVNEDLTLKSDAEVAAIFANNGVDFTKPCVFHCRSGILATLAYLLAEKLAPQAGHRVFDGSWTEYSARIAL